MAIKVNSTIVIDNDRSIYNTPNVGVNTNNPIPTELVGAGSSFQGIYLSNAMVVFDNTLNGNHYIGTAFNALVAGPVENTGIITVDGNLVVV
jgi:hypothetical protein